MDLLSPEPREYMVANAKNAGKTDPRIHAMRQDIDAIDDHILDLFNRRLDLARQIGKIKDDQGDQIQDARRENRVLQRLLDQNKGPISKTALRHIYSEIMSVSREIQRPRAVCYLGPEATFTHIAAMKHFGHFTTFTPQPGIRDVFTEVQRRTCHYGVIPVENSVEGAISHALDLFYESELKICAEIYHPVSFDLLSGTERLQAIACLYAHPHALAQCRTWLHRHLPQARLIECTSTAAAARQAAHETGAATIAARETAHLYNLRTIASQIEDMSRSVTRFLVIGQDQPARTGQDKTSIMFVTAHAPGALYKTIEPLAAAKINMDKLESRPIKHQLWRYVFFADIIGHMEDPGVRSTLEQMKAVALYLKWLGSYPRGQERAAETAGS